MKKFMLVLLLICSSILQAEGNDQPIQENNYAVVPGSSYCISNVINTIQDGVLSQSECFTFYTFDGNPITKRTYSSIFEFDARFRKAKKPQSMLDKNAPKPQPVRCKVWHWPAYKIFFTTKGVPGWFITFYDKNNRVIAEVRFDKNTYGNITISQLQEKKLPLDLSNLQRIEFEDKKKGRLDDRNDGAFYLHDFYDWRPLFQI